MKCLPKNMKKKNPVVGRAIAVLFAGLALAAPAARAAVPHEGHGAGEAAAVRDRLTILSQRMQELAATLESEMNVEKSVATARERWNLDDEKANDLATLLTHARDRHAAHGGGGDDEESRRDLESLVAHVKALAGDDGARWLHEKFARVDGTAAEMRALGSELAAAALSKQGEAMAQGEEAARAAEHARKHVEESYRDAIAKFKKEGSDDWKELVARTVDKEAIEAVRRSAMARKEAAMAEHMKAAERFRDQLASQQGDLAERHRHLADAARQLAEERYKTAAGAEHEAVRHLLESHAKRAEELAVERARAAELAARGMEERHRAHAGAAKERARKMGQAEREKAISKRRGEKSELDSARAEIEALQRQIEELQRRVETLREESGSRHDPSRSRDV